jgi:hypothetical protein
MKENKKNDPIIVGARGISRIVLNPSLKDELGDMDIGKLTLTLLRVQRQD